ncbi:MAG TPA: HTTM domain-containing protein [Pirellulales bacterium]
MTSATMYIRAWLSEVVASWNQFWFRPADPATLGLVRICAGAMLLYTHLVWSLDLQAFFGDKSWLPRATLDTLQVDSFSWSYLWWFGNSPVALWCVHLLALVVFVLFTIGLFTRATGILAAIATLAYIHRVPAALFGLDQINAMLVIYLAIGPSGAAYSLDNWLKLRAGKPVETHPLWTANLAIRLIQIHLCIIYLFAGTAKLTGPAWWDGTAMWMALGNMEYQSLDMTWLADWPRLINLMTHVTVYWEIFYCALIWPRLTRPVMLLLAIPLHMGIAICLGMVTFGLVMLIANLAFLPPAFVRAVIPLGRRGRAGEGERTAKQPPLRPNRALPSAAKR